MDDELLKKKKSDLNDLRLCCADTDFPDYWGFLYKLLICLLCLTTILVDGGRMCGEVPNNLFYNFSFLVKMQEGKC